MADDITYFLPETRVRFTARVTRTTDTLLGGEPSTDLDDPAFAFEPWRDNEAKYTAHLDPGLLRDLDMSLGFSEDQRLTSFDGSSTGHLSEVIKASVTLVATGAGLLLRGPAGVGGVAAAAVASAVSKRATLGTGDEKPLSPAERAWAAYEGANKDAAARLTAYKRLRADAATALLAARQGVVTAIADPIARREAERQVASLARLLTDSEAELARLTILFQAWWHGHQEKEEQSINALWEQRHLPRLVGATLDWDSAARDVDPTARSVWDEYGVALARDDTYAPREQPPDIVHGDPERQHQGIWVRHPRLGVLHVVHSRPDGAVRIERTERRLLMDDKCQREFIPLDKGLFGKRSLTLSFSSLGALTGIKESRTGAGDLSNALGAIPAGAAGALESTSKMLATINALRASEDTEAVADLKRQIERKTQDLNSKGLDANEDDFAELQRLKQMVEIVNARKTLAGASPALVGGLGLTDGPNPPPWFPAPSPSPVPPVQVVITVPEGASTGGE